MGRDKSSWVSFFDKMHAISMPLRLKYCSVVDSVISLCLEVVILAILTASGCELPYCVIENGEESLTLTVF